MPLAGESEKATGVRDGLDLEYEQLLVARARHDPETSASCTVNTSRGFTRMLLTVWGRCKTRRISSPTPFSKPSRT